VSTKAGGKDKELVAMHWGEEDDRSDGEEDGGSSEDKWKVGKFGRMRAECGTDMHNRQT